MRARNSRGEWKLALRFGSRLALFLLAGVARSIPIGGPVWFMDALRVILFAPPNQSFAIRGPAEILRYIGSHAEFAAACALALALLVQRRAGLTPLRWSAGASLAIALVVMSNRGSDYNHLLELQAIACVAAGILIDQSLASARRVPEGETREVAGGELGLRSLPALLGALVIVAPSWRDLHAIGRQAHDPGERRAEIVLAIRAEPGGVLTKDPLLALLAGRPRSRSPHCCVCSCDAAIHARFGSSMACAVASGAWSCSTTISQPRRAAGIAIFTWAPRWWKHCARTTRRPARCASFFSTVR